LNSEAENNGQEGEGGADADGIRTAESDIEEEDDDYEEEIEETEEDEDEEEAYLDDGEFNDTLKFEGVLTGEEWLTSQFLLSNNEAMAQTVTISKKIEEENKDKLNKSDISQTRRPISPFGTGPNGENPFSLSKMGYANPVSLDRTLPSALKTRNKIPRTPENGADHENPHWKEEFQPDKPFNLEDYIDSNTATGGAT